MKNRTTIKKTESRSTRREFLRKTAGAASGLFLSPFIRSRSLKASALLLDKSRVVIVTDGASLDTSVIDENIVQVMVDAGIVHLTGYNDIGEAWKSLFPDLTLNSTIGIKVNCINRSLSSHPEVAYAIVEGLKRMTVENEFFSENNIIIWDRTTGELRNAGYTINTENSGVRCFATNQGGVGYSNEIFNVHGKLQRLSRIVTESIDYLINLSVLKNHGTAGVTLSLKNHYGTCKGPGQLHGNFCNPYIPALNALTPIRDKQVICITDALMGIVSGGPGGSPQITPKSLIFSSDPVAQDTIGAQILEDNGCGTLYRADHIHTASQSSYNLGTDDPDQIELVTITDPSTPGSLTIATNTVTQGETIQYSWADWPGTVNIAIYKGEIFWKYIAMERTPSGSEELDTSGWEIRDDYKLKIILSFNESVHRYSDTFTVQEPLTDYEENQEKIPEQFKLYQNYPNPFNPSTMISYQLQNSAHVELNIYDLRGVLIKKLMHEKKKSGVYTIKWNGKNGSGIPVPSGTYLASLKTDGFSKTIKMQLIR